MNEREANHQKPTWQSLHKSLFVSLGLFCRKYRSEDFGSCTLFFCTRFMRCRTVLTARSPDWQCLLGTFLFGARYPAWWPDAERQDDWRPRIGIKTRFRRMKSLCPDPCTDEHKDQWLFDADFLLLYFHVFAGSWSHFFWLLACWRRRWCFQHVAGLRRVFFLFFSPMKHIDRYITIWYVYIYICMRVEQKVRERGFLCVSLWVCNEQSRPKKNLKWQKMFFSG